MLADWRTSVAELSSHLETNERALQLLAGIDAHILTPNKPTEEFLLQYGCEVGEIIHGGAMYALYTARSSKFWNLIAGDANPLTDEEITTICSARPIARLRKLRGLYTYAFMFDKLVEMRFAFKVNPRPPINPFEATLLETIMGRLALYVRRRHAAMLDQHKSRVFSIFFDNKLKPQKCWDDVLDSSYMFFPDFIGDQDRLFLRQLLLYRRNEKYLRLAAGRQNALTKYILVDKSISGLAIQRDTRDYLVVDPRKSRDRYIPYGETIATEELIVPLRSEGTIVGMLNLERFDNHPFSPCEKFYLRQAADFLQPLVAALQERFEAYKEKEILLLYIISDALSKSADAFAHLMSQPILEAKASLYRLARAAESDNKHLDNVVLKEVPELRDNIHEITNHYKEFGRGLPAFINKRPIDLTSTISARLAKVAKKAAGEGIRIRINADEDVKPAYATGLLQEHVFNIVNNSCQSIRRKHGVGSLSIATGRIRGNVEVYISRVGGKTSMNIPTGINYVRIRVQDNGSGAKKRDLRKIGEERFTTRGENGNGFGVRSAREYFQSLGGLMEWDNRYDRRGRPVGFLVDMFVQEFNGEIHEQGTFVD